jgi:hypothetical protein
LLKRLAEKKKELLMKKYGAEESSKKPDVD